jgi:hypothetical protein
MSPPGASVKETRDRRGASPLYVKEEHIRQWKKPGSRMDLNSCQVQPQELINSHPIRFLHKPCIKCPQFVDKY